MVPCVGLQCMIVVFPGHILLIFHGALGWSVVYDCGVSWSYSLNFSWCLALVCSV